ncbi:MAG TPA: hypothetical protein VJB90_05515 [Candidatus Nanoarchaeia archaeon]|nr:hypothetical protein [Candidatus Nanoarchaeia archaeon]
MTETAPDLESLLAEIQVHLTEHNPAYVQPSPVYEVGPNERYPFPAFYTLRFLKPVTIDTGKGFGWSEGLGGLNYVGTGRRFARSDWIYDSPDAIITHEIRHDGPLFHGHDLAEYWNRIMDALIRPPAKSVLPHQPNYDSNHYLN